MSPWWGRRCTTRCAPVDAEATADRLLAAPLNDHPAAAPDPSAAPAGSRIAEAPRSALVVARQAEFLSPAERTVLIDYVSAAGRATSRVIEHAELTGDAVIAHCHLRDAERMFILSRIRAVSPA